MLEQYSPFMGENLIDYPMLEEYGVPTLEEVPDEGPEDDDDDENENDSTETEHKDKKEVIKHTGKKKMHSGVDRKDGPQADNVV